MIFFFSESRLFGDQDVCRCKCYVDTILDYESTLDRKNNFIGVSILRETKNQRIGPGWQIIAIKKGLTQWLLWTYILE